MWLPLPLFTVQSRRYDRYDTHCWKLLKFVVTTIWRKQAQWSFRHVNDTESSPALLRGELLHAVVVHKLHLPSGWVLSSITAVWILCYCKCLTRSLKLNTCHTKCFVFLVSQQDIEIYRYSSGIIMCMDVSHDYIHNATSRIIKVNQSMATESKMKTVLIVL